MISTFSLLGIILFLLLRLIKIDNIHFKSAWIASVVAVIVGIVSIVLAIILKKIGI